jgi:hypothetical protein
MRMSQTTRVMDDCEEVEVAFCLGFGRECAMCSVGRLRALDIVSVGRGSRRFGFGFGRFPGGAQSSGAVVAAILDIIIFWQGWDHGRATSNLADVVEDDLRPAVVKFDGSVDFNGTPGQPADVANIFQSGLEDHYCERAGQLIFAEVEKMNSFIPNSYFQDLARDASGFAYVMTDLLNGDAVGGGEEAMHGQDNQPERDCASQPPTPVIAKNCRALPGRTAGGGCPHIRESRHAFILEMTRHRSL